MANSVYPDQTAPIGAVCSGSTLFTSILDPSVMLGNYLQPPTSADDIFRCIFFLGTLRVKTALLLKPPCQMITYFIFDLELHMETPLGGGMKIVLKVLVTWQRWLPCPYMLKNVLFFNPNATYLVPWHVALVIRVLPSLFKWWSRLTLTYFSSNDDQG